MIPRSDDHTEYSQCSMIFIDIYRHLHIYREQLKTDYAPHEHWVCSVLILYIIQSFIHTKSTGV